MDPDAAARRAGAALALLLATAAFSVLGAGAQVATKSLALSPPTWEFSDPPLVPGGTQLARMTVFNAGDREMDVTTSTAEAAGGWITADPATFHLALEGRQEVSLRIAVPADARKGSYVGRIDFNPVANGPGGNGSEVLAGVSGLLFFTVDMTEVHDLAIDSLQAAHIHRGEPLPVQVQLRNNGNVPDAYRLDVEVLDADRTGVFVDKSFDSEPLTPGDNRTDTFSVPVPLAEGQYAYNATVTLLGTETVLRRETGLFLIAAPGTAFKTGSMPFLAVTPPTARPGQEVRFTALFRNEGVLGVEAQFVGTLLRDGEPIGAVQTPLVQVGPHRNATLAAPYVPDEAGRYLVRGHVVYDGLRTEEGEAGFEVAGAPGLFGITLPAIPAYVATPFGLLLLAGGLRGFFVVWRRRRDERRKAP